MSARRIGAAVCASLALTLGSAGVAFAYGTDSVSAPSATQDPCFDDGSGTVLRGTNGDDTGLTLDARNLPKVRTICGFGGNDTIHANDYGDHIYAGPGSDTIYGGAGPDYIEGQGGDDTIYGGGGADMILGQTGNDTIYANDLSNTDDGAIDTIDGGTGNNKCHYITSGVTADHVTNCVVP
jgi:Ca2+-binding RTX toxin-like protein